MLYYLNGRDYFVKFLVRKILIGTFTDMVFRINLKTIFVFKYEGVLFFNFKYSSSTF